MLYVLPIMKGEFFMELILRNPIFKKLKMAEIQPTGWLLNQLKIQAGGLSGNLDKFWPDIKDSQWIGGTAEGWERVPYWLDGFIPLAWLLNDQDMKTRASYYVNYIIENQSADGWICPQGIEDRARYDMWALFLILKVLVVYHNATEDERIEEVVRKGLLALDRHIDGSTLFNWAQTRWFECLIPIYWLYERKPDKWIINLAIKLQGQGFDWKSFYKRFPYKTPDEKGRWSQMSHTVNTTMMLKSGALLWRMTGSQEDLNSAEDMVSILDEYHGTVTGVITGDECLAGTSPVHGTELCSVAELMYSLEHLLEISGRSHWGDRLEKVTFNALPATYSPDMWTHQYDQQVNQVECSKQDNPIFNTNGGEAHLFGLEPNFGCCTANLSQPWPKFALSTFMRSCDGLVASVYAPCSVNTKIKDTRVSLILETDYPFKDVLNFKVKVDREVNFAIWLRIPAWTQNAVLELNGISYPVKSDGFHRIEQNWKGETTFTLHIPMKVKVESRPNNLYAVTRGPLVYSLPVGERWVQINENLPGHEAPHCDFEVHPTTPWNYGLCINKDNPRIEFEEFPVGNYPFSPEGAPLVAHVCGKKVDWAMENGSATPYPQMSWVSDDTENLKLIPYGCTNLRITEMPLI